MNPETLLYLSLLMLVWIVPSLSRGPGLLLAALYIVLQWILSSAFSLPAVAASCVAAVSLLMLHCISSACRIDPFARARLASMLQLLPAVLRKLLELAGVRSQARLLARPENAKSEILEGFVADRNWAAAERYLMNLGFGDRHQLIEDFTDKAGCDKAIEQWLQSADVGLMSRFVSASYYIKVAWLRRGAGVSDSVTQTGQRDFYSLLELARSELTRAIEQDDSFADPYLGLITITMGTGQGREQLYHYFTRAVQLSNEHYEIHSAMINALSEKWGGEAEEARMLAAQVLHRCKSNSPLAGMVALAHIEHWIYLLLCDQQDRAERYFSKSAVIEELDQAYSVLDRSQLETVEHIQALNALAFCYYMGNQYAAAKRIFQQLDGNYVMYPWQYCAEPALSALDPAFAIDLVVRRLNRSVAVLRA